MKIIALPDKINPKKLKLETIMKRDSVCPFCQKDSEEPKHTTIYNANAWFGNKEHTFSLLFWTFHRWNSFLYKCPDCGAEWESEPFEEI